MKHKLPTLFIAGMLLSGAAMAQQQVNRCSTSEYMQQKLAEDPSWAQRLSQMDEEALHYDPSQGDRAVITIPVVFHVVYNTTSENISATRITEQINVLNEDYRKMNTDVGNVPAGWQSITADMEIQFCLATLDPQGNATTGINRVQTSKSSFNVNTDDVKSSSTGGTNAWDRNKYLNIWVCDLGGSVLGYAQFPGGPSSTDGVVLDYRYTGKTGASAPYNKGRTATHEVGHWLNLKHIWGDDGTSCSGTDNVADTPNQADENYNCYSPGTVVTDGCSTTAPGIMWMNYMDYTDDACMYMFTAGQKTRTSSTMTGSRLQLKTNSWFGCSALATPETTFDQYVNVFPNPSAGELNIRIDLINTDGINVKLFDVLGNCVKESSFEETATDNLTMDLSGLANGVYIVSIENQSARTTQKIILNR
jgi:hypothetical protein